MDYKEFCHSFNNMGARAQQSGRETKPAYSGHNEPIRFTIIYEEDEVTVECRQGEYRNLMVLINEKLYVEDFGECKGIGRCGTCLVEVLNGGKIPEKDRNENSTLSKCPIKGENLRLSCQIMITAALNNTIIRIIEERQDVR